MNTASPLPPEYPGFLSALAAALGPIDPAVWAECQAAQARLDADLARWIDAAWPDALERTT